VYCGGAILKKFVIKITKYDLVNEKKKPLAVTGKGVS